MFNQKATSAQIEKTRSKERVRTPNHHHQHIIYDAGHHLFTTIALPAVVAQWY
jgi:hypothetical protein